MTDVLVNFVDKAEARARAKTELPEYSDFAIADKFARYRSIFRHVTNRNDWYFYDGKVWVSTKSSTATLLGGRCALNWRANAPRKRSKRR